MDLHEAFDALRRNAWTIFKGLLVVAIAVTLGAVIVTYEMNTGPSGPETPNPQWEITNETSYVRISHTGGDAVPAKELTVTVQYESMSGDRDDVSLTKETFAFTGENGYNTSATLRAGGSFKLFNNTTSGGGYSISSDAGEYAQLGTTGSPSTPANYSTANIASIELIRESSDTGRSQTVETWER